MTILTELRAPPGPRARFTPVLIGSVVVCLYSAIAQRITSVAAIPEWLRLDGAVVALAGAAAIAATHRHATLRLPWAPWAVCGALGAAAIAAPWVAVPWLLVPALLFAKAGRKRGPRRHPLLTTLAIVALAGTANLAVVVALTSHQARVPAEEYLSKPFLSNTLLNDVPLDDAWVIRLRSEEPVTVHDFAAMNRQMSPLQTTPMTLVLGGTRALLGAALGWDDARWNDEELSFGRRLTESQRAESLVEPGSPWGPWRLVYAFESEGAMERINATVHLALTCAIVPGDGHQEVFTAFHVKEVNWSTSFYMGLINPFRRWFMYPPIIEQIEHTWIRSRQSR